MVTVKLLLSERLEHLELLETELLKRKIQPVVLTGKKQMGNLENSSLILATSKYVGEEFDNQQLDTLMLTLPFSWKGNTKQYLERLERGLITKSELRVYDYIDISVEIFAKMYQKRRKVYRKMGYQEVSDLAISKYHASYYDDEDYCSNFLKDILLMVTKEHATW